MASSVSGRDEPNHVLLCQCCAILHARDCPLCPATENIVFFYHTINSSLDNLVRSHDGWICFYEFTSFSSVHKPAAKKYLDQYKHILNSRTLKPGEISPVRVQTQISSSDALVTGRANFTLCVIPKKCSLLTSSPLSSKAGSVRYVSLAATKLNASIIRWYVKTGCFFMSFGPNLNPVQEDKYLSETGHIHHLQNISDDFNFGKIGAEKCPKYLP